jgi:hypothetical protein
VNVFCLDFDQVDCHEPDFSLIARGERVIVLGPSGQVLADMGGWKSADKVARACALAWLDGWRACQRQMRAAIAEGDHA